MKAGSVRSLALQSNADEDEMHSAFYCPVPTTGNPTEALANRFQCAQTFKYPLAHVIVPFTRLHEAILHHQAVGQETLSDDNLG